MNNLAGLHVAATLDSPEAFLYIGHVVSTNKEGFVMKAVSLLAVFALTYCAVADEPGERATEATNIAQQDQIDSAESAGLPSISEEATVLDWEGNVLRQGSNEWTCLPDRPDTPGNDPWCVTAAWMNFLEAYAGNTEPTYSEIGFAYMLMGDTPVSNSDPYATEPTGPDDWVTDLGPHLMMLVPDASALESISTDHLNGGPWIMWPDTPYVHIMIPLEGRGR